MEIFIKAFLLDSENFFKTTLGWCLYSSCLLKTELPDPSQRTFSCSKLTIETLEEGVKNVQSQQ